MHTCTCACARAGATQGEAGYHKLWDSRCLNYANWEVSGRGCCREGAGGLAREVRVENALGEGVTTMHAEMLEQAVRRKVCVCVCVCMHVHVHARVFLLLALSCAL